MRAALIEELGGTPTVGDAAEPRPGEEQVLVEVTAAPLNPIDLSIASGSFYAGAPETPYVPGKEGVGRVLEGGSLPQGALVRFETPGGLGGPGSLAQRAAPREKDLLELPEGVDDAVAACLGIAGLAAWLALEHRAGVGAGERVLILGASGPVGQIAVQAARLLGAGRVVAAARSASGLARARELGADATVELGGSESPAELGERFAEAAAGPIDVTVDPLWGEPVVAAAHAAADGGRIVQIGQSAGADATLPSSLVRGKLLAILGHTTLKTEPDVVADAYRRLVEHAVEGRLTVDYEQLALERVAEAWEHQQAFPGKKLVLRP